MDSLSIGGQRVALGLALAGLLPAPCAVAAPSVEALAAQNDALRQRVEGLEAELQALRRELREGRAHPPAPPSDPVLPLGREEARETPPAEVERSAGASRVILSGEVAVAYFDSQREGAFPAGQFRLDDAKVYLDAEVRPGLYTFLEVDVALRENDEEFRLGELYLELDDIGRWWGSERSPTVRLGRLDVPFGEEYTVRQPLDNPLISHSLADFWGVDEGVEVFGEAGAWSYVVALQNGSRPSFSDFTSDKALTVRVGWNASPRLHVSGSFLRTGKIDAVEEELTELWWGGAFLRSIGDPATTRTFEAQLGQLDVAYRWRTGHLKTALGVVRYDDDDTAADNRRDLYHAMVEGVQDISRDVFAAARYSWIDTRGGYPIAGQGDFGKYFFGPFPSEEVWRLSLGLGYRAAPDFLLKFEYSLEGGRLSSGADRDAMDQFATQAAVRF